MIDFLYVGLPYYRSTAVLVKSHPCSSYCGILNLNLLRRNHSILVYAATHPSSNLQQVGGCAASLPLPRPATPELLLGRVPI
eukprot:SAG31_NODE_351_length_17237_cov_7.010445_12_plen_82_part_00